LLTIFDREFQLFQSQLHQEKHIEIQVANTIKQQLIAQAIGQNMGARPLRRLIEDHIIAPVTDKLLSGEYHPGTRVTIGSGPDLEIQAPLSPLVAPRFDFGRLGQRSEPALPPSSKRSASPDDGLPHLDNVPVEDQTAFDALFVALARRLSAQGIALAIDRLAKYFLCAPGAAAQKPRQIPPDLVVRDSRKLI
jgi:hypothetical protein